MGSRPSNWSFSDIFLIFFDRGFSSHIFIISFDCRFYSHIFIISFDRRFSSRVVFIVSKTLVSRLQGAVIICWRPYWSFNIENIFFRVIFSVCMILLLMTAWFSLWLLIFICSKRGFFLFKFFLLVFPVSFHNKSYYYDQYYEQSYQTPNNTSYNSSCAHLFLTVISHIHHLQLCLFSSLSCSHSRFSRSLNGSLLQIVKGLVISASIVSDDSLYAVYIGAIRCSLKS